MLAVVSSSALIGVDAHAVQVEVNTGEAGEAKVFVVGLPDAAVKESTDRVQAALSNSGFRPPETRSTVNLAPGNIRKEGPIYDLPIALGMLASTRQIGDEFIHETLRKYLIAGELSLSGATRPVRGGLAMAILARKLGMDGVILPTASAEEAALVEGIKVYGVKSLDEAARFLTGEIELTPMPAEKSPFRAPPNEEHRLDFAEVKGQHAVRRAVEIAVAGGHNLFMI